MERGYIRITEKDQHEFTVEEKLINWNLWQSTVQMATVLNAYM